MARTLASLAFSLALVLTSTPAAWAQATEQPRWGGTLIFAIDTNPETLNPATTTGVAALAVTCRMFNGLVYRDRDWNPQPELAESWTISDAGLRYVFKLRKNVRWHDGRPFTSADVQFTFQEVLAKYHARTKQAFVNVTSVETPDPHTVVVNFARPYAPFLSQMTCQEGAIVPRHLFAGTDILKNPHSTERPIGTGPFRFKEWVRGSHIVMERNPDYFRKELPYLDRMIAKIVPDRSARLLALESGDVDYIQSYFLPKEEVARLAKLPTLQLGRDTDLPGNFYLFFNTRNKPLDTPQVRHALAMALDRQLILDQVFFGLGAVSKSAIHRAYKWAVNPEVDYMRLFPYAPGRANRLLDEAGLARKTGGARFGLRLVFHAAQAALAPIAEIMRENWKAVGVDVVLEPVERQVMIDKVYKKYDFDVNIHPYTTAGDPAIGISRVYVTIPPGVAFANPTGYSNKEIDDLFARAAAAPTLSERGRHYRVVQALIARDLPTLSLVDRTEVDLASVKFRGLWQSAIPYDLWDRVWWVGGRARP